MKNSFCFRQQFDSAHSSKSQQCVYNICIYIYLFENLVSTVFLHIDSLGSPACMLLSKVTVEIAIVTINGSMQDCFHEWFCFSLMRYAQFNPASDFTLFSWSTGASLVAWGKKADVCFCKPRICLHVWYISAFFKICDMFRFRCLWADFFIMRRRRGYFSNFPAVFLATKLGYFYETSQHFPAENHMLLTGRRNKTRYLKQKHDLFSLL